MCKSRGASLVRVDRLCQICRKKSKSHLREFCGRRGHSETGGSLLLATSNVGLWNAPLAPSVFLKKSIKYVIEEARMFFPYEDSGMGRSLVNT